MDKNELIVKQQLEIEELKLDIKNMKEELIPLHNESVRLQQFSTDFDKFPDMGMHLAMQVAHVLLDMLHEN